MKARAGDVTGLHGDSYLWPASPAGPFFLETPMNPTLATAQALVAQVGDAPLWVQGTAIMLGIYLGLIAVVAPGLAALLVIFRIFDKRRRRV